MVYRSTYRQFLYVLLVLFVMVSSWEYQQEAAASVFTNGTTQDEHGMVTEAVIPEDSLRLRVLGNSDAPADQWLKRKVRDRIVDEMHVWAEDMIHLDEARKRVQDSLADFESIAEAELAAHGNEYEVSVEYGDIPFPTNLYGNRLYPAGVYEGILVTIGEGQGDNWWCVLFPPLCFIDIGTGDAVEEEPAADHVASQSDMDGQTPEQEAEDTETEKAASTGEQLVAGQETVETRLFIVELFDKVKSWFA
jgi:stage II sporulation protein R